MSKQSVLQIRCSKRTKQKWVELVARFGGYGKSEDALLYYIENYDRFREINKGSVI